MAPMITRRIMTVLLALFWLAVVGLAVYLAVTRYEVYGYASYLVPAMAVFMLVIFVLAFLPKAASDTPLGKRLGHLATGALILLVLLVLFVETIRRWRTPFSALVLGFFFVIFLGIFRDWLRSYLQPKPSRSARHQRRTQRTMVAPQEADRQTDAHDEH
jgi:hypothetical protein